MEETIPLSSKHARNFNEPIQVIGIKTFYEKYKSENKLYANSRFSNKKKGKSIIPFIIFKKIILKYFTIYFNTFYFSSKSVYFPFGGLMKKVLYPTKMSKNFKDPVKKTDVFYKRTGNTIGFFWYLRPSAKMFYMVDIKRMNGSTNRVPKIERNYLITNDKDLIPIFTKEKGRAKKNKTLYIKY